jgi:signal transduction histidine kinase
VRGIRARLTVTLLALVALTTAVLGIGSYLFVDYRLHEQAREDAAAEARFDLSVVIPDRLPDQPTIDDIVTSRLGETLRQRLVETVVDFGQGDPYVSNLALDHALDRFPGDLRQRVAAGELAYAWVALDPMPALVIGGRLVPSGPDFYFVHDATQLEETLAQLRLALAGGALVLVAVALLVARAVARGVLSPVNTAALAAQRIERGDLATRVPVASSDEFGTWAESFNRMAEALGESIGRLETAQAQNRRFVADVAHELRTPLGALVAEASILREDLDSLPPDSRRAAELLVGDIARLRGLVEDLMELSRFDAAAEQVAFEPVNLLWLVHAIVEARLPTARVTGPVGPVMIESDPRRLERIIGNLLDNAREHAPGSPVLVEIEPGPGDVTIAVSDEGPGLPPGALERIFDRFYKADPSRHGGSSGLGLAIASEHARLIGGRLQATNRPAGGLRLELRLPVTGSLPDGDRKAMAAADDGSPSTTEEPAS